MKQHNGRGRWILELVLIASLLLLSGCTLGMEEDPVQSEAPTAAASETAVPSKEVGMIHVSGVGAISVKPDLAIVTLGVQTEAPSATEAMTNVNSQMDTIVAFLKGEGLNDADIKTQQVELTPRYRESRNGVAQIVGYGASTIMEVQVKDLKNLGTFLDKIVQAGGNQIQGIRFELVNSEDALDQARGKAWENALRRAEVLAQKAGATLGTVTEITETNVMPFSRAATAENASVSVMPGMQTVQVEIQVTWVLMK